MTRFQSIGRFLGLAIILCISSVFAQKLLLDDFTDGDNANYLDQYWYYYDDNRLTGPDDRPQATPASRQSTISVPYTLIYRHAGGNLMDTFKIRNYAFCVKEQNGNKYGTMPFIFGEKWKASYGYANPYVGMNTMLVPDGKSMDLTSATAVKFKLRSHLNDLTVGFIFKTMDITRDSTQAYYQTVLAVTKGVWTDFTISPADLYQPGWATAAQAKPALDIAHTTEFAWEVFGDNNPMITSDTLDIDDVVIEGVSMISPPTPPPPSRPLTRAFCDFETIQHNTTPFQTYWYAFDDREYQGNSTITRGAYKNPSNGLYNLDWVQGTGFGDAGYGPRIEFSLGKTVKQATAAGDTINLQGFAGIGFNVYDSAAAIYFNAKTGKMGSTGSAVVVNNKNSIYFEYVADGDFKCLTLEIRDIYDVPDKNNPDRKDSRGAGNVWHYDLPKSMSWKSAEIPFDSLVIDSVRKDYVPIPLDKSKLANFYFTARGEQSQSGIIRIDNVYFPGIDCFSCTHVKNSSSSPTREPALRARYLGGRIRFEGNPYYDLAGGAISLLTANGKLIKTCRMADGSDISMNISGKDAGNGLYFIQVSGTGSNGKKVTRRSQLFMTK